MLDYSYEDIAGMIDHSLLNPVMTDEDLREGCRVAIEYRTASVCIKPYFVADCARILDGSGVLPSTTIGFPHGGHVTAIKLAEAQQAMADGAVELDMVVNIGKVLSGDWNYVKKDLSAVIEAAHRANSIVKVIFENCFLNSEQKIRLCEICGETGADFVKTSTGYGDGGATVEDLKLMRQHSPAHVQVKAAGGVRDLDTLLAMRAIGVTRVGATRTAQILDECKRRLES